jgi:uncharacterized membrane protein
MYEPSSGELVSDSEPSTPRRPPPGRLYQHEGLEFARALTFFDAIFAFAVTLLITTVDSFNRDAWTSLDAMWKANGSSLTTFTISFLVVVAFWRANHQDITTLKAMDARVVFLNCLVLFTVVLIPFTTEALGKKELDGLPLPVAVYALNIVAACLMQMVVLVVANRRGLRNSRMTGPEIRIRLAEDAVLPVVFLASIPIAYTVGTRWAEWMWGSLLVLIPLSTNLRNRFLERLDVSSAGNASDQERA